MKGKFPNGVAAAMKREGVGLSALARLADLNRQTLMRYRDGERHLPTDVAQKLAPFLKTTAAQLLVPNEREGWEEQALALLSSLPEDQREFGLELLELVPRMPPEVKAMLSAILGVDPEDRTTHSDRTKDSEAQPAG